MKISDLKKLDKNKLIELLSDLSRLNKENDAFLQSKLNTNHADLFMFSCRRIDKAFSCFALMSLRDARNALIDFKKSTPENSLFIELCMYYINKAYELENKDWRFQENFYSAIEKVYIFIFDILKENVSLKGKYVPQVKALVKISNEGWGHREYLMEKMREIK